MYNSQRELEAIKLQEYNSTPREPYKQFHNDNMAIDAILDAVKNSPNPCVTKMALQQFVHKGGENCKLIIDAAISTMNLFATNSQYKKTTIKHLEFNNYVEVLYLMIWIAIIMTTRESKRINSIVILPDESHIKCFKKVCNLHFVRAINF